MPTFAPSSWNCTLATPTLSVALAATVTGPDSDAPLVGEVRVTTGGVVSGMVLSTLTATAALVVELPVVSTATAVKMWFALERSVVLRESV